MNDANAREMTYKGQNCKYDETPYIPLQVICNVLGFNCFSKTMQVYHEKNKYKKRENKRENRENELEILFSKVLAIYKWIAN